MARLNGFDFFDIIYNYKNVSEFFTKYEQEEKKKDLLNNYLIYCFIYKKFNHIKSIINHFNLDTVKTRLICNREYDNFNLSFVCFGVFCDDIDFVKYLLNKNCKQKYKIDQIDYCNVYNGEVYLNKVTPLFVAVVCTENRDMIDLLIEYGANINAEDYIDSTPIMKVINQENIEHYKFLISRGANINLQDKANNTALHYIIRQKNFDIALQLINQCGANPFLVNYQKRDAIMEFIICMNISAQSFFLWYGPNKKIEYIENLLAITNSNPNLIYELFAASIDIRCFKIEYFNKVKNSSTILHNDYKSKRWREKFNAIVGDDNDENYCIQSVKVLNRLLHVYDCNIIINTIVNNILKFYELQYDKYIELLKYVLDVVTDNLSSFKLYGSASNVYELIFRIFLRFVLRNFQTLSLEKILENYRYMMNIFMNHKHFLENQNKDCYTFLIDYIHTYIYHLYKNCFYDAAKREMVENYIKDEYPINLLTINNDCILHSIINDCVIFKDKDDDEEEEEDDDDEEEEEVDDDEEEEEVDETIIVKFLSFIIECNHFKHLNLRNNKNQTPLQLATLKNRSKDIIQLLLDHGSIVSDLLNTLHSKYHSLNILQNHVTLQNLAAIVVKKQKQQHRHLPKRLQNFVNEH